MCLLDKAQNPENLYKVNTVKQQETFHSWTLHFTFTIFQKKQLFFVVTVLELCLGENLANMVSS